MMLCKTVHLGCSTYRCPECNNTLRVFNTCKSRFCNSCGVKYAKQRALNIESKLISGTHRHLVFTISDILWPLFLEDSKRLNFMFEAVSKTLLSWYKEKYKDKNLTPGFILTLHTFGRDDKWNVHIHCLLSEFALGNTGEKKMDFIPFDMLRKRFQKILLDLLENDIGNLNLDLLKIKFILNTIMAFMLEQKRMNFLILKKLFLIFYVIVVDLALLNIV